MKFTHARLLSSICIMAVAGLLFFGCDYARMNNDEAVDLYETELPDSPGDAIPIDGGLNALKLADLQKLSNPLASNAGAVVRGRAAYQTYCSQCHGPNAKGFGTVGQSFAPLPADLHAQVVQSQSDGQLYARISLGYRRHPAMYSTVTDRDRWSLVSFIRSLAGSHLNY
jgi:mono/diheme cytochrome c family protein